MFGKKKPHEDEKLVSTLTTASMLAIGSLLIVKGYISKEEMDIAMEEIFLGGHKDVEELRRAISERLYFE